MALLYYLYANRVTLYVVATDQTLTPFACHVAKKKNINSNFFFVQFAEEIM